MSRLPKLKIKLPSGVPNEYVCELEQAKDLLNFDEAIFLINGQGVHSYDELVKIAMQDKYRDQEFIEVDLLQPLEGG